METIKEAKQHLKDNWDKGTRCPCCTQWVQRYPYSFHSGMARALIYIYQATQRGKGLEDDGFFHIENYFVDIGVKIKGSHGKLKYWGMLEQRQNTDPKKHNSGYWSITQRGIDFVHGKLLVTRKALLFNEKCYGFVGNKISIQDALGKNFDYQEMMNGNEYEK